MKQTRKKIDNGAVLGIIAVMVSLMLLAAMPMATAKLYGDVNGDGLIDEEDITYVEQIIAGKAEENELADANRDGVIDLLDVAYIEGIILGDNPFPGGKVAVAAAVDFKGLHPGGIACCSGSPICLIYEPLVNFDYDNNKIPGLAESWDMSSDGKEWTFYLREGVKFHDGSEFDAEDVKFTFEWDLKHSPSWLKGLEKIKCPDEYTVKFFFNEPQFILSSYFALAETSIMSSTTPLDKDENVEKAIGTGPFKAVKWVKSQEIVLERNNEYWGEKAKLEKVTFKIISSPETRQIALEAGELDVISCRELLTAVPELKLNPKIKVVGKLGAGSNMLYMGTQREPFTDVRVRKAINYAVDKETPVKYLLGEDVAVPMKYMFSAVYKKFINPDAKNYEYDPEKAKQLLKDAGWKDEDGDGIIEKGGKPFEITLTFESTWFDYLTLAEYFQDHFKNVGIQVTLNPVERALMREKKKSGDFDLLLTGQWFIPHDDPSVNYKGYFHSTKGRFHFLRDPELDNLIDELDTTGDPEERLELHYELQKEIMNRAPAVYLYTYKEVMAMKKSVKDFEVNVHDRLIYQSLKKAYTTE